MKILITGGAGFIGSHLCRKLLAEGHHVHLVDDLSTGSVDNVKDVLSDRCVLQTQTVSQALSNKSWLSDYDAIYHLAAAVGVQLIVDKPVKSIETNIHETSVVLEAAAAFHMPVFIASSSEVYGKSAKVPFSEEDDVVYGSTIYSRWSYAMAKALDEYLALAYFKQQKLPVVTARFFNTVGPRQIGRYGMVIPRFIEAAKQNKPLTVYGDGEQTRCFCHVEDVVNALPKLLANPDCYGKVFNLGSDEEVSIKALAQRVIDKTGSTGGIEYLSYDEAYQTQFDDLRRRVPDLSRIREAIGFKLTKNLDDILDELI